MAGNYPAAVGYYEGRRWFGGTDNKPQNVWATRSGTESNMSYSIPTRDDDSIRVRLTSRQANRVRHIIPLVDPLLLTSGAEWRILAQNSDAITQTSVSYKPQDYVGASNVQPVVANGAVIYAQDRGGRVREMRLSENVAGVYVSNDISILAPHLFDDYTIVSMTHTRAPTQVVWAVRSDGKLLGMTYVPEHKVAAWHQHDTDGEFKSVTSIPEGSEDVMYAIVKREVNGRQVRYVERQRSRRFDTLADCFFVDAGATYSGAPTSTISGLWHLVGKTVRILADGAVLPAQVVPASATLTLPAPASVVHVGLSYTCDIKTLPLATEAVQAAGMGLVKNINKVHLRVYRSSGVFVGPSVDKLTEYKQRTDEPYGTPPNLISGEIPVTVLPSWQRDGAVFVRQANPLPLTLLSMVMEANLG